MRRALAVRHVAFEDLGILEGVLDAAGYETDYLEAGVDPITGPPLLEPDLVVVLGGPIGVYETDAYPFLAAERAAIGARVRAGRPTLGICLGAQLIAAALGARVRSTGRKEIGYAPLTLTASGRDSVLAPLDGIAALHWHGDEFAIPEGASRLAETPGFPNQAFEIGASVLGLQFHLEADPHRVEQWLIGHAHELADSNIDPVRLRADAGSYGPALASAAAEVFRAWLESLPPAP